MELLPQETLAERIRAGIPALYTPAAYGMEIFALGELDPEHIVTPGIFDNGVVEVADPQQEESLIRAGVVYA